MLRRKRFRPLAYQLLRKRACCLEFRMVRRRPTGVPSSKWEPHERREVFRNGYQPKVMSAASRRLAELRVAFPKGKAKSGLWS